MIDISDGLAADLHHLCEESRCGAVLRAEAIPISPAAQNMNDERSPLDHALSDGEDFELLFTVHPDNVSRLPKRVDGVGVSRIGEITNEPNVIRLAEKNRVWELEPQGFEHFSQP